MRKMLAVLALATAVAGLPASYVEANGGLLWASFKQTYGKQYSGADEGTRRAVFMQNMLDAAAREAASATGAQHGMTQFSDLTRSEFRAHMGSPSTPSTAAKAKRAMPFSETEAMRARADSKDWRTAGCVGHVKNQGACSGSWAFAACGSIEGQWCRAGHTLTAVSEQELISCQAKSCQGNVPAAFAWLVSEHSGAIVTEDAYPYESSEMAVPPCRYSPSMATGAVITGSEALSQDEDQLAAWLITNGPFAVTVDADSWQTYMSGVLDNCPSKTLDHDALVVGVTPTYWIVKNSWGSSWGESGYIRLKRGSDECGITLAAVAPTV
eukprot:TRINITY_DN4103_c0_g1_i1.p1 TRINITY_DN4103_c0_g1~~TRINITY_DN4103_c0_g1_i1.p1  ORF type:complete len:343 (+),score=122.60 TRINITY_DN4103_c0_g1_i1:55-1029(+)